MINQHLVLLNVILIIASTCRADIKLIQGISRHGARYPASSKESYFSYPNDPHKDHDWTPDVAMSLTKAGKSGAYDLGVFLKNTYPSLNESLVYFYPYNSSRTVDTARFMAAGFYSTSQKPLNLSLPLGNVSDLIEPLKQNATHQPMIYCENYYVDLEKAHTQVKRLFAALRDVQDLYKFLSCHTGVKYTTPRQVWALYNHLVAQSGVGLTLEPWTKAVFPNGKLRDLSATEYITQSYTARMKRLVGGVWIKKFLDHVDDFIANKTMKMESYFYVSSEAHITGLLNTLGIYKPHVPDFLSTILFELHEVDEQYYVKVIYRNANTTEDSIIPGCEKSMCLLSTFRSTLINVTMKNFEEDCGNRGQYPLLPPPESIDKTIPKCGNFAPILIISMPLQLLVLIIVNIL